MSVFLTYYVICLVVAAACTDFKRQKIPNILTIPSVFVGLLGHVWLNGWQGLVFSVEGLGVGLGVLLGFYILGGMAAGDVKLLGAIGAIVGPNEVFTVFLATALLGGLYSLGMMLGLWGIMGTLHRIVTMFKTVVLTGTVSTAFSSSSDQPKLRYGLVIALGALFVQFGHQFGMLDLWRS